MSSRREVKRLHAPYGAWSAVEARATFVGKRSRLLPAFFRKNVVRFTFAIFSGICPAKLLSAEEGKMDRVQTGFLLLAMVSGMVFAVLVSMATSEWFIVAMS